MSILKAIRDLVRTMRVIAFPRIEKKSFRNSDSSIARDKPDGFDEDCEDSSMSMALRCVGAFVDVG